MKTERRKKLLVILSVVVAWLWPFLYKMIHELYVWKRVSIDLVKVLEKLDCR